MPDIAKWNADRKSKRVLAEVAATTAEAERLGFTGTPSFAVKGPGTDRASKPSARPAPQATSNRPSKTPPEAHLQRLSALVEPSALHLCS